MPTDLPDLDALDVYDKIRVFGTRQPMGCCLHVVLDDGNHDDESVACCVGDAADAGHAECSEIAARVTRMSRTQRRKASVAFRDGSREYFRHV